MGKTLRKYNKWYFILVLVIAFLWSANQEEKNYSLAFTQISLVHVPYGQS